MLAAAEGHDRTLRMLLQWGGHRTLAVGSVMNGDTALHIAARNGHTACVHTLTLAKADLGQRNHQGREALELAGAGGSARGCTVEQD